jgi:formylmethanofuran dehydrogenase subunit B
MAASRVEHVTCLGCGCGCDDLTVSVDDGRIVDVDPGCPVGRSWFGDGSVPSKVSQSGQPVSFEEALTAAVASLTGARGRVLVYLGHDITSQAQRLALTLADLLGAAVDTATSETAATGLLAVQRRGRAGATVGEIRNRADVMVFWGVDPAQRYPRFIARYVEPAGTQVQEGRAGRTLVAVNVGSERGPKGADLSLDLKLEEEIAALSVMRASLQGHTLEKVAQRIKQAVDIAERLSRARYAVLVHDAEPTEQPRNPLRVEALIALAQALNGPTRATLISLRAGGNRPGAEAVLTSQSGYPFSVDYSQGPPRYLPTERGLDRLAAGAFGAALVVGSLPVEDRAKAALAKVNAVLIGPRSSEAPFPAGVAIDTGVAGIHEAGTAYRLDEVPLRLRPPLHGPRSVTETLGALINAVRAELGRSRR